MTVTLDYRTDQHLAVTRARLTLEMVQAEAEYRASVTAYINAAITDAVMRSSAWAAETAEALREAAIVNDVAMARWNALRSQLAQLPPKRLGINHNNTDRNTK